MLEPKLGPGFSNFFIFTLNLLMKKLIAPDCLYFGAAFFPSVTSHQSRAVVARPGRCCRCFLVLVQGVFMFIIGAVFILFYIVLNGTSPYDWSHPMHAYPLFYLGFTVLLSCFLLRHLCSCRKSAMIGGIPRRSELREPRKELHFENADEGEAEAEEDGFEFMPIKTIVSEDSYFGI